MSKPKPGTYGTYRYLSGKTGDEVVERFKIKRVEGNICLKSTNRDGEQIHDLFIWRFQDCLNRLHDWPGKNSDGKIGT